MIYKSKDLNKVDPCAFRQMRSAKTNGLLKLNDGLS
jgi:hypothetical protein